MNNSAKIVLGYVVICLIWGSTWLAIKFGLESLTPLISAGLRFLLASIIIFTIVKIKKIEFHLDSLSIKLYIFLAFFSFAVPFWLVYWAEQFVPSGLTSVMFGMYPFSVFVFSWFILKGESADFYKFISVIFGFIGILIIFWDSLQVDIENYSLGLLAVLLSAILQGSTAVTIKKWGTHLHPLSINAVPLFIAGISMVTLSFLLEKTSSWEFSFNAVLSIIYLSIVGTIAAFTIYYWLLKQINAVILALSSFITPIIAIILGWLVLNEKLSAQVLFGALFVLIGILFGNFKQLRNQLRSKKVKYAKCS
ncbi:MAG: DMT family transporter [Ignavibacteriales bacterium]|nr:DMT family transporter [Ignavibacteriales bacterium]MBK7981775.1 DMT family transporter [Ignavibacteriota bacterium]